MKTNFEFFQSGLKGSLRHTLPTHSNRFALMLQLALAIFNQKARAFERRRGGNGSTASKGTKGAAIQRVLRSFLPSAFWLLRVPVCVCVCVGNCKLLADVFTNHLQFI